MGVRLSETSGYGVWLWKENMGEIRVENADDCFHSPMHGQRTTNTATMGAPEQIHASLLSSIAFRSDFLSQGGHDNRIPALTTEPLACSREIALADGCRCAA